MFWRAVARQSTIYSGKNHEDIFEFFLFVFSSLCEDCERIIPPTISIGKTDLDHALAAHLNGKTSFLFGLYYFVIRNVRRCRQCGKFSVSFEIDNSLMLPLTDSDVCLQNTVNQYLRGSNVSDFACGFCKTIGSLIFERDVVAPSDILVIVLKR